MTNLNKPQTNQELLALFGKARDEELNHAEAEILNDLLIADSRVRGLYRGFIAIESGLEEIAQQQSNLEAPTVGDVSSAIDTNYEIHLPDILNLNEDAEDDLE